MDIERTTPDMDRRLLKTQQALPNHASSLASQGKVQTIIGILCMHTYQFSAGGA